MIGKTDKLFDFIQAMTSHERGYFKQSANKDSWYVILFDAICRQKEYDEDELARYMKKMGCMRKISAVKEYLWRELTQAMAPYHLIKTPLGEAMAQMQALHLMQSKGLNKHITKELRTLKKFCIEYELYDTLLQTLQFEFRVGFHQLTLDEQYWKQFHDVVHANMVQMQLSEIQHRLHLYVLKKHGSEPTAKEHQELKVLLNHPVLTDKALVRKIRLRLIRESIFELYAHLMNDYPGIVRHNIEIADLLESKPALIKDGREISLIYTNVILALASAGQRKQLIEVVDEIIEKLRKIPHHNLYSRGREMLVTVIGMLTRNDFTRLNELIANYREHSAHIPVSVKHNLYYAICIALYKSGQTDEALDWINYSNTFYIKHKRVSDNNMSTLMLLHIFIHYEMGNLVYARNKITSFMRNYKSAYKENDKDPVYVTVKQLRTALNSSNPEKIIVKLKDKLENEFDQSSSTIYFSIPLWLESIVKKKPYHHLNHELAIEELG